MTFARPSSSAWWRSAGARAATHRRWSSGWPGPAWRPRTCSTRVTGRFWAACPPSRRPPSCSHPWVHIAVLLLCLRLSRSPWSFWNRGSSPAPVAHAGTTRTQHTQQHAPINRRTEAAAGDGLGCTGAQMARHRRAAAPISNRVTCSAATAILIIYFCRGVFTACRFVGACFIFGVAPARRKPGHTRIERPC